MLLNGSTCSHRQALIPTSSSSFLDCLCRLLSLLLFLMIIWQAVPAGAAIAAGLGGQVLSVAAWLAHTQILYGRMTVSDTLQRLSPTLDGTLISVVSLNSHLRDLDATGSKKGRHFQKICLRTSLI